MVATPARSGLNQSLWWRLLRRQAPHLSELPLGRVTDGASRVIADDDAVTAAVLGHTEHVCHP